PGALGVAWAPQGENSLVKDVLTRHACKWLKGNGVKICQAFADSEDAAELAPLERNGFNRITQLVYLRRSVNRDPGDSALSVESTECVAWSGTLTDRQANALLASQIETLDCPELNEGRTNEEILTGFSPGTSARCPWLHTIEEGKKTVGVLLFDI